MSNNDTKEEKEKNRRGCFVPLKSRIWLSHTSILGGESDLL
jgi:hypothetical protein